MPPEGIALKDIGECEALGSGLGQKLFAVLPGHTADGAFVKLTNDIGLHVAKAMFLAVENNLSKCGIIICRFKNGLCFSNAAYYFDITNGCLLYVMLFFKAFAFLI